MLTAPTLAESPDDQLWEEVQSGNTAAFEEVVHRHQSAVCAVAFAFCGDRTTSEDITQEAFWISWKQRESLEHPERLRAWLCGISRNLARQSLRTRAASESSLACDPAASQPAPVETAISAEEEDLVWRSLEEIPETYREPLVLFYREQQSVADVASALDLSVDAVKQRLTRGRSMLREQVQHMVEGTLRKSRPGAALTVAIMTGLASSKAAWGATASATGATLGKVAAASSMGAIAGPVIGTAGGLAGAWLGTWLPAQLAATNREREFLWQNGRQMFIVSILFTLGILASNLLPVLFPMSRTLVIAMVAGNVVTTGAFVTWIVVAAVRMNRRLRQIQQEAVPHADENHTPLRRQFQAVCHVWRGRVWQSSWNLCGLPLIDCNVSDPHVPSVMPSGEVAPSIRRARGWIAIGDEARGVLFALGSRAYGGIAIGGKAVGVVAIGGIACGMFALGGGAFGLVTLGGGAVGAIALGGVAVGWQAAGGLAVAWDVAVGGLSLAQHAAFGGCAMARDFAVGGMAQALHANDDAAKAVLMTHPLKVGMDWYAAHNILMMVLTLTVAFTPSLLCWPLLYRRATDAELQTGDPVTTVP